MVEDATKFRVVLVRDASMPDGYRILTAFPKRIEIRHRLEEHQCHQHQPFTT